MRAYLSKSGREIWHVDYFNWIVSPDQSRDQSLFISFSQMGFFMQAKYEYLCFYFFSAPLLHYFSWGGKIPPILSPMKLYTAKASFDEVSIPVKCLFSKRRGLYTVVWKYISVGLIDFIYLFIIGILCMELHIVFLSKHMMQISLGREKFDANSMYWDRTLVLSKHSISKQYILYTGAA